MEGVMLKGFKTVVLAVVTMVLGGLTGAGFLSPDLSGQVNAAVSDSIAAFEQLVGAIQALIGILILAVRAVTDTRIFKDY
jgi:hypothetical protein